MSRLFDKLVKITGTRPSGSPRMNLSLLACVMDGSLDSPFDGEHFAQSSRRNVTVIVKKTDLCGDMPRIGDVVTLEDDAAFAVKIVQPFYDSEVIMDCRQC